MCGRARQVLDWSELKIRWWSGQAPLNTEPRWNAAPRQRLTVVRWHEGGGGAEAVPMRWGFIPFWEKDAKGGRQQINAKMETISSSRLWRDAFKSQRCIVPVNGFYEWEERAGVKTPYAFDRADGQVMMLAGLWSRWKAPEDGQDLLTFAIITGAPNNVVAEARARMPVILELNEIDDWLSAPVEQARALMKPLPGARMIAYPVNKRLGDMRNEGRELLNP